MSAGRRTLLWLGLCAAAMTFVEAAVSGRGASVPQSAAGQSH